MVDPFALTGAQFLGLYTVLLMISIVAAWVLRRRALSPGRAAPTRSDLDVYEKAVLSTGTTRQAVDTALAQLAERGLQIDEGGRVLPGPEVSSEHPVEQAVLTCLDTVPTRITLVRSRAERHDTLVGLRDRLVDAGLLNGPEARARVRRAALAFAPLLVLGVAWLGRTVPLGRPVWHIVALLAVTVVTAGWFWGRAPTHTLLGKRLLDTEHARNAALRTAAQHGHVGNSADAALALALFGLVSGAHGQLRTALTPHRAVSSARHSCGSGGCGGAGCGGGSCGGCGGCES